MGLKKPNLLGFDDGLGALVHVQLAIDVFCMIEDRIKANKELGGNLFVFKASSYEN